MSKLFKTPLKSILKLKEKIEESCSIAFKNSSLSLEKEKGDLSKIQDTKEYHLLNGLVDNEKKGISESRLCINQMQINTEYMNQLNGEIEVQNKMVIEAKKKA